MKLSDIKANNIEEYFGTFLESVTVVHEAHLKASSYAKHEKAFKDYYEDAPDVIDSIIESYMGVHGKIKDYKCNFKIDEITDVEYFELLREFVIDGCDRLIEDEEIKGSIDTLVTLIDSTLYKLKELTESRNNMSLKDFISSRI